MAARLRTAQIAKQADQHPLGQLEQGVEQDTKSMSVARDRGGQDELRSRTRTSTTGARFSAAGWSQLLLGAT